MNRQKTKNKFNPNENISRSNNIFGLPFNCENASVVLIPVPWDVTATYKHGSSKAPESIFNASFQIDLYDEFTKDAWKKGIAMDEIPADTVKKNIYLRKKAQKYIKTLEDGKPTNQLLQDIKEINGECRNLNNKVREKSLYYLKKNKIVGLIGGEHSVSTGLIQALSEKHKDFGILQIDAHADLRNAYLGFEFSHASSMYNALKISNISKLVQVGIRDYCEEEAYYMKNSKGRIITFTDSDIKRQTYQGKTWDDICKNIINKIPGNLYVSFDIDGLDPKLCPNTGTPVPGGLEFEQITFLLEKIVESGKKIIGFDLCEVSPGNDEWDANVGSRALYKLATLAVKSKF